MQTSHLPDPNLDAQFYQGVTIKRLLAWVIDVAVVTIICLAVTIATLGLGAFIFPLIAFVSNLAYRILCLQRWSATLGMRTLGIEIRNWNGDRVTRSESIWHTALHILITITGLGIFINAVMMMVTERGQGLHDMVLGTTAINRPLD